MKTDDLMLLLTYKKAGFEKIKKDYYETLESANKQIENESEPTVLKIGGRLVLLSQFFSVFNRDFKKAELNDFMVEELINIIQDLKRIRNDN